MDPEPERRRIAPSRMRRAVAERMSASKPGVPHFYVSTEVGVDALRARLAEIERERETRVTVTAALIRALASVLPAHPTLNAHWTADGHELIRAINIGVAIPVEDGLIAPAVLGCDRLGLVETATALADLIERTRAMRLRAAQLSEATFTVSNLGMFDVSAFSAIVIPPQVAILAAAAARPYVDLDPSGQPVRRTSMSVTLSADHRAVDGVQVARFLGDLKGVLEHPEMLPVD